MASPPNRADLADTPTVATYKLAIGALYDYVASLLGNGTATIASETEKKLARESLGIGSFGFKNRLINPEFLVSQEFGSASTAIVAGAAIKYVVDQWYVTCTGANISAQQIAGIADRQYSLRLTGASSNTSFMLGQRIEGDNCFDLKNKNVTVSLNSKSTSARTITWTAFYANTKNAFASKTTIASGVIDIGTSVENYQFTFNSGSNANNGIAIELSGGALLAGSTIDFDAIQFENSVIATEFEKRSTQQEFLLCQSIWETGTIGFNGAYQAGGSSYLPYANFIVSKRVEPTMTISVISSAGLSSIIVQAQGKNSFRYGGNATATGTVILVATYTASARL